MNKFNWQIDDLVKRGNERGRITGIVNEKEVRVYWYSGSNLYHETVNSDELYPDTRESLKAVKGF